MYKKTRLVPTKPPHINDRKGQRKLRKMKKRVARLMTTHHGTIEPYAPPIGSYCYKRWAWLFRP